jgi:serine protease Do
MRPFLISSFGATLFIASSLIAPAIFAQDAPVAPKPTEVQHLRDLSTSFETLASRVRPAVVQIFSTGYASTEDAESTNAALLAPQRSTGSGVIMTGDGYIITNNHVVQGARRIEVRLASVNLQQQREQTMIAKVVGTDRDSDLAVIKIEHAGLQFLGLGDSNALKQGQLVMAFGNPLGLEGSASMGIVSSVGRRLHPEDARVYIQTDAPINPGNSGGPLVDMNGQVVGINTLIYTQSGGSEGIGFAIPSNSVKNVYEQIRKDGHVHRGQIGMVAQTITPGMAKGLGLPQDWGVIAADVTPDGPADKAGLKVRDVVLTLNSQAMQDAPQMETTIRRLKLSEVVDMTVLRDGQKLNFTIPVIERDDDPQRFADMVNPEDNLITKLGILGIEINQKLSDMIGTLRHDYGIVVAARGSSPPYSGAALEPGDIIYEINRTPTVTVKALRATLDALKPGDSAVLQIERNSKLMYITIELE